MAQVRVLLAEDHEIVREGTRRLLERADEIEVVGEAGDGEEAVRLACQLAPDVVVMDVRMPCMSGLEATRRIRALAPTVRILVLSAYEDDEYIFPLLEAGASGYLLKTTNGKELVRAIQTTAAGGNVLDPGVTSKVVGRLSARSGGHPGAVEALTDREREVLQAVADGLSNREIAQRLTISTNTVQVHLRNIYGKLGVESRTEAVTSGLKQGLIRLEGSSRP